VSEASRTISGFRNNSGKLLLVYFMRPSDPEDLGAMRPLRP